DAFAEAVLAEVAHFLAELREILRGLLGHAALVSDDLRFELLAGVRELERDEALAGAVLQVLQRALVAGVVGDDEQEALARVDVLAALRDGKDAAVVGERMDEDGRVLPGLDDLIEIADGAGLHRASEGTIDPAGRVTFEQVAADEIAGGEVFVAGDGDERERFGDAVVAGRFVGAAAVLHDRERAAELPRHVLDETRLAAARWAL